MIFEYQNFRDIDLSDPFFDSLKADYEGFSGWFMRKSNEKAYIFKSQSGLIEGFLYHKIEDEPVEDVTPPLPHKKRVKIGTFKIDAHGTRMGERFIKKSLDYAFSVGAQELYVTIFEKHDTLVSHLLRYGFKKHGTKTTQNGTELVLLKEMGIYTGDTKKDYPFIEKSNKKYLLSIKPYWHSKLLPDSILNNEDPESIIEDVSHANSIHKIYLGAMKGMDAMKKGDLVVIYRTTDRPGQAWYRSVATSVCTVEGYKNINEYKSLEEFLKTTESYSIFSREELIKFYNNKYPQHIIKFSYNLALPKRLTNGTMIDELGVNPSYWGFFELTDDQFDGILKLGQVDESIVINKT